MVFEFLIVLIFSLLLGNGLLFFASPRGKTGVLSLKDQIQGQEIEDNSVNLSGSVYVDQIYEVQASLRGLDEKIKLAHERISELEETLGSINSVFSSPAKTESGFGEKIIRLENFRKNAKIELEAIKKLLQQLKEFRKIKTKKKTNEILKKEDELNEKIHGLVFNVKKKGN
jgi:chromosome segregation ATPase